MTYPYLFTYYINGMIAEARPNYEGQCTNLEVRSLPSQLSQISAKMLSIEFLVVGAFEAHLSTEKITVLSGDEYDGPAISLPK